MYAKLPFYPGPVSVGPESSEILGKDFGPPRSNPDFAEDYQKASANLRQLMGTRNEVIMATGEAMLGLWSALKCCLLPGDTVVSVATGVFGDGFGDMASALGCIVEKVSLPYNSTINEEALDRVDDAIRRLKPAMITAVHCETPSGTLNPLAGLGRLKRDRQVPLLVVDAVSSLGGAEVLADDWGVDILLGGSQKCLAGLADMTVMAVSGAAWEKIERVNYQGYEALRPFHNADSDPFQFPYTPNWAGIAALKAASSAIVKQGLQKNFARHAKVAEQCRSGLEALNIALWPDHNAINSPTVTAAYIPSAFTWPAWRDKLQAAGLIVGGSLGPMHGRVFRLGHMGPQADSRRMKAALQVIGQIVRGGVQ